MKTAFLIKKERGTTIMHLHKYEKYWLILGTATLIAFLIIVGIGAFHKGSHPNNAKQTIDYEKAATIAPFNNTDVQQEVHIP